MTGLAGILRTDYSDLDQETLRCFRSGLPVRAGRVPRLWTEGAVALLRCCSPWEDSVAPAVSVSRDGRLVALFDGRLSHRRDLAHRLQVKADACSDAELAVTAFAQWGEMATHELEGIDYTLAIWDRHQRRLLLQRSPMGWRPLYWCESQGLLAFATEARMLLNGLNLERRADEAAVAELMVMRFVTQTGSLWQGIHALPAGSRLDWVCGRRRVSHWHRVKTESLGGLSTEDHVERFRSLFDAGMRDCLDSPGPVAAHLSGGLDSSTVVMRAAQLIRVDGGQMPVVATVRYPGEACDESRYSDAVIEAAHIEPIIADGLMPYDWSTAEAEAHRFLLPPMRPAIAHPLAASPQWKALQPRVVLTGEGGDDWLGGHYNYLASQFRHGQFGQLLEGLFSDRIADDVPRRLLYLWRHGIRPLMKADDRLRLCFPHLNPQLQVPTLLQPDWARRVDLAGRWQRAPQETPAIADTLWGQSRYAPFVMARRRMAWEPLLALYDEAGLQLRHPFHDPRLTAYLFEIPGHLLRRHVGGKSVSKWLLREATRDVLPEPVRNRQDKANFSSKIADAVLDRMAQRDPWRLQPVQRGWVSGDSLEALVAQYRLWQRKGRPFPFDTGRLSTLWAVVAVDTWLEQAAVCG
ncbi:asparagine synthetase B [Solimonas sp. SE-A11]|uniref:asparagine synthetase B family protein n=1 Tax=Solimonas sp. SE-A11 TaxID=3054954 RepID=UPI00259D25D1|nr:asparagine synthase-related protein [Solimonas sp. SE-A11]MDM4772589.1 asparagine synthase-related protein [Solimonas sp. SE-A11]